MVQSYINDLKMIILSSFLCLYFGQCLGAFTIYPHPSGIDPSSKFQVNLQSSSQNTQESFTYMVTSDNRAQEIGLYLRPHRSVSWTSFAFSGDQVMAQITTQEDFQACLVRPQSYGFRCRRSGPKTAEVVITHNTSMMSVEFDNDYGTSGHSDIVNKLLIFADAPEQDAPTNTHAENLLYYGPGAHNLNGQMLIGPDKREVYLAPGSYLHGAFRTRMNHPGVKIHGRGVLSGENYFHKDERIDWALISYDKTYIGASSGHVTEGITLVDPTKFYLKALGKNNMVRNIKTVAPWAYNSDGVALGPNGTVEDSFIMANDDSLKVYKDHFTASRCVIWQSHNGAVFQLGWWRKRVSRHVRVSEIDVIHTDWCAFKGNNCSLNQNAAVFDLAVKPHNQYKFSVSDLEFRNIRIESACPRLFFFELPEPATGSINDVRFINWSVGQPSTNPNIFSGSSTIHLSNLHFVNFYINNTCIRNAAQANVTGRSASLSFDCD